MGGESAGASLQQQLQQRRQRDDMTGIVHLRPSQGHQRIQSQKKQGTAIIHHRRRLLFLALIAMSSLMALATLVGFTFLFREMNSLTFIQHENRIAGGNSIPPNNDGSNYNQKLRIADLHLFSDQKATKNAEKIDQLREKFHDHCLCKEGGRDCELMDPNWILPEVPDHVLGTIKSKLDKTAANNNANERKEQTPADDFIEMLDSDEFWNNETNFIAQCPYVIMDLGSNRGDSLQAFLNVLLASIYNPSSALSPYLHPSDCTINSTKQSTTVSSYQFDLQSLSVKERTAAEQSERYDRVYKNHKLDMEAYLDLHIGRMSSDQSDPWMEFQLKQRMEQQQQNQNNGGDDMSKIAAMRRIFEEQMMPKKSYGDQIWPHPEQYCFYGVEGNPDFTRKLRALEAIVMSGTSDGRKIDRELSLLRGAASVDTDSQLSPNNPYKGLRPLRHVHFLTETVAAAHNGPTELFIDSVSEDHVGSSLLKSHKYAAMGGNKVKVQGRTLTSLLQQVLKGFGTSDIPHGHLILKIDIEGGEYGVLKEALDSKLLCNYAKKANNRVDLAVEFHKWVIEDEKERGEFAKLERMFYRELSSCGIHLTKMDISWH